MRVTAGLNHTYINDVAARQQATAANSGGATAPGASSADQDGYGDEEEDDELYEAYAGASKRLGSGPPPRGRANVPVPAPLPVPVPAAQEKARPAYENTALSTVKVTASGGRPLYENTAIAQDGNAVTSYEDGYGDDGDDDEGGGYSTLGHMQAMLDRAAAGPANAADADPAPPRPTATPSHTAQVATPPQETTRPPSLPPRVPTVGPAGLSDAGTNTTPGLARNGTGAGPAPPSDGPPPLEFQDSCDDNDGEAYYDAGAIRDAPDDDSGDNNPTNPMGHGYENAPIANASLAAPSQRPSNAEDDNVRAPLACAPAASFR